MRSADREVTGLIFALSGYFAHDVYETVPFMLPDSVEAINADRIATLVEYLDGYGEYLVVALLPEDATALDEYPHLTPADGQCLAEPPGRNEDVTAPPGDRYPIPRSRDHRWSLSNRGPLSGCARMLISSSFAAPRTFCFSSVWRRSSESRCAGPETLIAPCILFSP